MRTASDAMRVGDDSPRVGAVLLALDVWSWVLLAGAPTIQWSLASVRGVAEVRHIAILVPSRRASQADKLLGQAQGAARADILPLRLPPRNVTGALAYGLGALPEDVGVVLLCDAAMPLVRSESVRALLAAARPGVLAVTTEPVKDTVKITQHARITGTIPREHLMSVHAPLAAARAETTALLAAWASVTKHGTPAPRHLAGLAALAPPAGLCLSAVPGSGGTLRVASAEDLAVAAGLLAARRGTV